MFEAIAQAANQLMDFGRQIWQNNINKQNTDDMLAYNTPKAQMTRLKQAGLNPNLVYSQLQSGQQTAPIEQTAPSLSPFEGIAKVVALKEAKGRAMSSEAHGNVDERTQFDLERMRHAQSFDAKHIENLHDLELQKGHALYNQSDAYKDLAKFDMAMKQMTHRLMIRDEALKESQLLSLDADREIKHRVQTQKDIENYNSGLGLSKSDPWWMRVPANLGRHAYSYWNNRTKTK